MKLALLSLVAVAAATGVLFLEGGQAILQESPRLTLHSLSPHRGPLFTFKKSRPAFHGYPILGSVELTGEAKSQLLGKLYTSLAEEAGPARCFNPRHGIRATSGRGTIDLVICFECSQVMSYVNSKEAGSTIASSAGPYFNQLLQDANVPLPKD